MQIFILYMSYSYLLRVMQNTEGSKLREPNIDDDNRELGDE